MIRKLKDKPKFTFILIGVVLAVLAAVTSLVILHVCERDKRQEAEVVLHLAAENIEGTFEELTWSAEITGQYLNGDFSEESFTNLAAPFMAKDEILYGYLIQGDTVAAALPAETIGTEKGKPLSDYPYGFSIAKVLRTPVVTGPLEFMGSSGIFLATYPIMSGETYLGQVIFVVDGDYVLSKINLDYLSQAGYDYEFWQVDIEDGSKNIVQSSHESTMLADDERVTMHFPNEGSLLVQPTNGWLPGFVTVSVVLFSLLFYGLIFAFIHYIYITKKRQGEIRDTSLYGMKFNSANLLSFFEMLKKETDKGKIVYSMFLFTMDGYTSLYRRINPEQRQQYEDHLEDRFQNCIFNDHIVARVGDNSYVVVIFESLSSQEAEDIARGLALELLWKTELDGERQYVDVDWSFLRCPQDGSSPEAMLNQVMRNLEKSKTK